MHKLLECVCTCVGTLGEASYTFCYRGPLSHRLMLELVDSCSEQLAAQIDSCEIQRRIYHISVEMLQNALLHSASDCEGGWAGHAFFAVAKLDREVQVVTANALSNRSIEKLISRIDSLNNSTPDELHSQFMVQLTEGILSEKGGAGLGLIDIARKSENPIFYHLTPLGAAFSLFYMGAKISME